jgi:hypothetical protein
MAEPLRHRQTKEAATDMFYLKPPRHISTLPFASGHSRHYDHPPMTFRFPPDKQTFSTSVACLKSARKRLMHRSM